MNTPEYGSREFYKQIFKEYFADITTDDPSITYSIVRGFFDALQDWRDFHIQTCAEFNRAIALATDISNEQNQNIHNEYKSERNQD